MSNQTLIKDSAGTLETYFEDFRPATCTVTLYTDEGSKKLDAVSATVDTVSTSVSSAVAQAATTIALADASSVVSGRRYILGLTASTAPQEVVTVKSLATSTATLYAPTAFAHNSGDAFRCGRVTYSITATSTANDDTWQGGYAVWTPNTGEARTEQVDCFLRKIPDVLGDKTDLLLVFPKGQKMLDSELELDRAMRLARDAFLRDVGGKVSAHSFLGADDFRHAAALKFWLMRRHSFGEEWIPIFDKMTEEYEKEVAKIQSLAPADVDQDGATSGPYDGGMTSGFLERA